MLSPRKKHATNKTDPYYIDDTQGTCFLDLNDYGTKNIETD